MEKDPDTIDYQYWQQRDWLNPKQTFYILHKSSWFKIVLARFTGLVVKKMMV
jgi:hypothetical protein